MPWKDIEGIKSESSVFFFSPDGSWDPERRKRSGEVNDWLSGRQHDQGFEFSDLGQVFERPGCLGIRCSTAEQKKILGKMLAGLITRTLNWIC